jgi:hypothetical protein
LNAATGATDTLGSALNLPITSQIIGANSGAGEVFNGNFYDVLVYSTALTTTQRQDVEGYLAWKWGIQTTLPSNHPYRNSAPTPVAPQPLVFLNATNYSGSGAWLDESGNGKNATKSVGTIAKSAAGNSLVFDGSTAWSLPNLSLGAGNWTTSVWYKPTGTPTGSSKQALFAQNDGGNGKNNIVITYDFNWSGTILKAGYFTPFNGFFGTDIPLTTNNWVHIVSTYDGNIRRTYANNVLLGTANVTTPSLDGGAAYLIGGYFQSAANYIVGEIGHVCVYNGALSQGEVSDLYNQTRPTFIPVTNVLNVTTGLQLWLDGTDPLGNGTPPTYGTSITSWNDKSGNGANATSSGTCVYNS